MTHSPPSQQLTFSKHRIEGLTDAIFAVAMTLLVIELKIPETAHITSQAALIDAIGHLGPKIVAWSISFFVLAQFWYGNHRLFYFVKHVDGKFLFYSLAYLGLVSLMPFSSALVGEYQIIFFSQIFYAINLAAIALLAILQSRYVYKHAAVGGTPGMPAAVYHGARFRNFGLVFLALLSIVLGNYVPGTGNIVFALMAILSPISRRRETRELAKLSAASTPATFI